MATYPGRFAAVSRQPLVTGLKERISSSRKATKLLNVQVMSATSSVLVRPTIGKTSISPGTVPRRPAVAYAVGHRMAIVWLRGGTGAPRQYRGGKCGGGRRATRSLLDACAHGSRPPLMLSFQGFESSLGDQPTVWEAGGLRNGRVVIGGTARDVVITPGCRGTARAIEKQRTRGLRPRCSSRGGPHLDHARPVTRRVGEGDVF